MGEYTNALVSALQGASNAAASNVSGPVDLISWALRKAGVPVPSNPVLGSEWMKQKGLLAEPQNKLFGLLGESAGLAAPIAASAKAPQIARGLLNVADDFQAYNKALGPAGVSQATVWHGSPHKFDRFDSSKIGTGEGAQAYGHGLYLADSPGVAKSYQENLRPMRLKVGDSWVSGNDDIAMVATTLDGATSPQAVKAAFLKDAQRAQHLADTSGSAMMAKKAESARRWAAMVDDVAAKMGGKPVLEELGDGHLYKVDLPDTTIARMLDWDKPLSQQPQSLAELADVFGFPSNMTGAQAYDALTRKFGTGVRETIDKAGQSATASVLRQRGIPGIRYLDGGSRGAGAGTSNYVVFPGEESALTILERNGTPVNALVKALQGPR